MHRYIILVLIVGLCIASNFAVNGDFEQPLTNGWTQFNSNGYGSITRGVGYHPDADYEVSVYRQGSGGYGAGNDRLYQTIDIIIPLTDIDFQVSLKLDAWDNGSSWAGAACALLYLDENSTTLGVTRICRESAGCPWVNTPTQHLIYASDTLWHDYSFNINTELQNLSGVDPSRVAKITIALQDTAYNC